MKDENLEILVKKFQRIFNNDTRNKNRVIESVKLTKEYSEQEVIEFCKYLGYTENYAETLYKCFKNII